MLPLSYQFPVEECDKARAYFGGSWMVWRNGGKGGAKQERSLEDTYCLSSKSQNLQQRGQNLGERKFMGI